MHYQKTRGYKIFSLINHIGIGVLALLCLAPLVHVLAVSFSSKEAAMANLVGFFPVGFNVEAYKITITNPAFIRSFFISILRASIGTFLAMVLTLLAAYPLAQEEKDFKGRTVYAWIFVFTMLFGGGLIPTYLVIQKVGLINTFWVMVIPGAVQVYNIILLLNFFRSVPKSLAEAAYIDGANHVQTLISVYIPISVSALATISLFSLVGHWNSWFDALIYISKKELYPMATLLHMILATLDIEELSRMDDEDLLQLSNRSVKAAQIFIAMAPIIAVYPFLQKYFVTGIKLGSVKE